MTGIHNLVAASAMEVWTTVAGIDVPADSECNHNSLMVGTDESETGATARCSQHTLTILLHTPGFSSISTFHLIKCYTLWLSVSFQTLADILNYSVLPMCPGTVGQSLLQHLWKGTRKKREHMICITADIFILLLLVSFAHFCSKFVLPRRRCPSV